MSKLKNLKAILIDLSGTLHIGNEAIPGSIDALKRLFCTKKASCKSI